MRRNMVLRGRTRVDGMMGRDRISISLVSLSASVVPLVMFQRVHDEGDEVSSVNLFRSLVFVVLGGDSCLKRFMNESEGG